MIGKKVIVRGKDSSVFYGTLAEKNGAEVKLERVRRLWRWEGACSTFQIAKEGVKNPAGCKFTGSVSSIVVCDVAEILPCTDEAIANIEAVPEWKS